MNKEQRKIIKKNKWIKPVLISIVALAFIGSVTFKLSTTKAEQSGSSPNNDPTISYLKQLYTDLQTLTYGSDTNSPDYGAFWNRILTAAKWTPTGNAGVTDVKNGQTFFNSTRTVATGTYPAPSSCSTQQYHDSFGAPVTQTTNCTNNINWIANASPVTGDDATGYDPRTGLSWSQALVNTAGTPTFSATTNSGWTWDGSTTFTITAGSATAGATYTNNGQTFTVVTTISSGTSLNTTGTGLPAASGTLTYVAGGGANTSNLTFSAYTGTNAAVGNKTAKLLCSERGNGWRLPSQKELMQAYIDGSYFKLTQPSNPFWSATETSATNAWYVYLLNGSTPNYNKSTNSLFVRCVR